MKKVFISYSRKDIVEKNELIKHLTLLKRLNLIRSWDDSKIEVGSEWRNAISKELESSDIFIFLISSNFIASDYINDVEIKSALKRYRKGEIQIFPVILNHCLWKELPFGDITFGDLNAIQIYNFEDRNEGFYNVSKTILDSLKNTKNQNALKSYEDYMRNLEYDPLQVIKPPKKDRDVEESRFLEKLKGTFYFTLFLFAISFIIGGCQGFNANSNYSDEEAYDFYISNRLSIKEGFVNGNKKFLASFVCSNGIEHIYDIESQKILPAGLSKITEKDIFPSVPKEALASIVSVNLAVYFGSRFRTNLLTRMKGRVGKLVIYLAAIIPGYSLGYKTMVRKIPSCSDDDFKVALQNEENWKKYEKLLFKRVLQETSQNYYKELIDFESINKLRKLKNNELTHYLGFDLFQEYQKVYEYLSRRYKNEEDIKKLENMIILIEHHPARSPEIHEFVNINAFKNGYGVNINEENLQETHSHFIDTITNQQKTLSGKIINSFLHRQRADKALNSRNQQVVVLKDRIEKI